MDNNKNANFVLAILLREDKWAAELAVYNSRHVIKLK